MKQSRVQMTVVFFLLSFTLFSCVDDDVCDKPTTPRITFAFKDIANNNYVVDSLFIERVSADGAIYKEGVFIKTDSASVPMNPLSNKTVFRLYNSAKTVDSDKDIITVNYQTQQEFLSKACGLRIVYSNVSYELTQAKKIITITPITTEIKNEAKNLSITY